MEDQEEPKEKSLLLGDMLVRYKNDITELTKKVEPKDDNSVIVILEIDGAKLARVVNDATERLKRLKKEGEEDDHE